MREIRNSIDLNDAAPNVLRIYEYWRGRCGEAPYPTRARIDPLEFSFALGHVSLVEAVGEPPRFRYRLVSTALTEHLGYEMTGKFADEIPDPEMRAYTAATYTEVLARGGPLYDKGNVTLDGKIWTHETLFLPLSSD